ncbi:hypothetical protein MVEN_02315300 [Mycena venus]|uniref:DDE Tnp4 domain-containing protein n=1 Tax=Mycena venus TaxID=2733690 RepID=A0A8H6X431_9AGAR|nr:hypothetical protein MVEN_02315300 [Mycena venus]
MQRQLLEARLRFVKILKVVVDEWDQDLTDINELRQERMDIQLLSDAEWLRFFRFTQGEVHLLVDALDLPEIISDENHIQEDRVTALCMLLRRLAYPCRLVDMEREFGWEASRVSSISFRFDPHRLTPHKLAEFTRIFIAKGCPVPSIAAIIDGTLKKTARPSRNQRILFNGWKRIHCLKYHLVVSPDGIIIHVYSPVEGRRHDATVLKESGLLDILDKHFWGPNGERYFIYGDPAYQTGAHIMAPYKGAHLTEDKRAWNAQMSKIQEPVEWMFKEVNSVFKFLNFSENQKVLLSPCGLFYMVPVLLTNAHTILHLPQTPRYFNCTPPSLNEYFHGDAVDDEDLDAWCMTAPWTAMDSAEDDSDGEGEDEEE